MVFIVNPVYECLHSIGVNKQESALAQDQKPLLRKDQDLNSLVKEQNVLQYKALKSLFF